MIELYIKSIDRRWKKEVAGGSRCNYILSPYITSKTAESVLSRANGSACEIYTLFSADLFCSKASSLKTIKNLIETGHKVFHLPGLHAKVFLVPGAFASIGSQNLTHAGTRHKEASVALFDKRMVEQVEKQIAPWLAARIAITLEMIAEMEKVLIHLEPQYHELLDAAETATQGIIEAQLARDEEERRNEEERLAAETRARQAKLDEERRLEVENQQRERQQRWFDSVIAEQKRQRILEEERLAAEMQAHRAKVDEERKRAAESLENWRNGVLEARKRQEASHESQLQREREAAAAYKMRVAMFGVNSRALPASLSTARGVVCYRDSYWPRQKVTLAAQNARDLTSWTIDGAPCSFSYANRYLIVHEQSGKAGWGRIVKTRITFIGRQVGFSDFMHLGGNYLSVSRNCDWDLSPKYGRNMYYEINDRAGNRICTISAWFDLKNLEILNIERASGTDFPVKAQDDVIRAIENNSGLVASKLLKTIVAPFLYVTRLYGDIAEDFFGPVGSAFSIRAAMVSGHPILVVASDR